VKNSSSVSENPDFKALSEAYMELVDAIDESIRCLFKTSSIARKAVVRDRYALSLLKIQPSQVADEALDIDLVGDLFPRLRTSANDRLRARLAQANNQRRRYLLYCEQHQQNIQAGGAKVNSQPESPVFIRTPDGNAPLEETHSEKSSDAARSTATTVDAAVYRTMNIDDQDETASQFSTPSYVTDSTTPMRYRVAELSDINGGNQQFICPYCRQEVSFTSQTSWNKHVLSDLKAYVCLEEECGVHLFSTSRAWSHHHTNVHLKLCVCPYCKHKKVLTDVRGFGAHLQSAHALNYDEAQLAHIFKMSHVEPTEISTSECPFCDWRSKLEYTKPQDGPVSTKIVSVSRFQRHITAHMEQVALCLLAIEEDNNDSHEEDDATGGHAPSFPGQTLREDSEYSSQDNDDDQDDGYDEIAWPDIFQYDQTKSEPLFTVSEPYLDTSSGNHKVDITWPLKVAELKPKHSYQTIDDSDAIQLNTALDSSAVTRMSIPASLVEQQGTLKRHYPTIKRGYACQVCFRTYDRQGECTKHEMSHLPHSARPHACPHCEKRFVDTRDLRRHIDRRHKHNERSNQPENVIRTDQPSSRSIVMVINACIAFKRLIRQRKRLSARVDAVEALSAIHVSERVVADVQRYAQFKNKSPCGGSAQAETGPPNWRYKCPNCSFSTDKPNSWKRHLEMKYPQDFWYCNLCCQSNERTYICSRADKFSTHLRAAHGLRKDTITETRNKSKVEFLAYFPSRCPYENARNKMCQQTMDSWHEYIDHLKQHCLDCVPDGPWTPLQRSESDKFDNLDGTGYQSPHEDPDERLAEIRSELEFDARSAPI
jgi:sarcosine oxidase delta subunit